MSCTWRRNLAVRRLVSNFPPDSPDVSGVPRIGRLHRPGLVVHVITRLADYRIKTRAERDEFLRRLGKAVAKSDWLGLAYSVITNHCHTVFLSGYSPSERITRSCHTGFAGWLNATQGCRGRVMLCRPTVQYATDPAGIARLIAYVHNNPAKLESGKLAKDSSWTSHRAYLGIASAPDWIDVDLGLRLAGFAPTPSGRADFDEFANQRLRAPEADADLGNVDMRSLRSQTRVAARVPVEIGAPRIESTSMRYDIVRDAQSPARILDIDNPTVVIEAVAKAMRIGSHQLCERGQRRIVVSARRVATLVWVQSGRAAVTMARALGISESTASYLRSSASPREEQLALEIAGLLSRPSPVGP